MMMHAEDPEMRLARFRRVASQSSPSKMPHAVQQQVSLLQSPLPLSEDTAMPTGRPSSNPLQVQCSSCLAASSTPSGRTHQLFAWSLCGFFSVFGNPESCFPDALTAANKELWTSRWKAPSDHEGVYWQHGRTRSKFPSSRSLLLTELALQSKSFVETAFAAHWLAGLAWQSNLFQTS